MAISGQEDDHIIIDNDPDAPAETQPDLPSEKESEESPKETPSNDPPETPQPNPEPIVYGPNSSSEADSTAPVKAEEPKTGGNKSTKGSKPHKRLFNYYKSHLKWTIPVTILVICLIILAIPSTRYSVLGLFIKKPYTLTITDSTTNTPVSRVQVSDGGISGLTNANGAVTLNLPIGSKNLTITKQYYQTKNTSVMVSLSSSKNSSSTKLVALGRQVPITVVNLITQKGVAGAVVKVLNTDAKTDASGKAIIVLPTNAKTQSAVISASGYNNKTVIVTVTAQSVTANNFSVTPAGQIYFLSNLSGKIDVVKTNLDGTNRQTVEAGTGNEQAQSTSLLASRDWKYLALQSQRDTSGNTQLNLINTSNDQITNIDKGNADFTPIGWAGDYFVYIVNRLSYNDYQKDKYVLKSYNANNNTLANLDQGDASGTSEDDYFSQQISDAYIVNNSQVVYAMGWNSGQFANYLSVIPQRPATLMQINANGQGKTTLHSFSISQADENTSFSRSTGINLTNYTQPNQLQVQFFDGVNTDYYLYQNNTVTASTAINDNTFYSAANPTFLSSPSGNQYFWAEPTDGKNTLFIGSANDANKLAIATLTDYNPYGWYTDNYLLYSSNGSQLFIKPPNGGNLIFITNYFKPSQIFQGYGGGYGGI